MYRHFDLASLEQQYSPSSCIDDINVFIEKYIQQSQQALTLAEQKQKVLTNLAYGKQTTQTLDLFLPDETVTAKQKLQIFIHGGYWQELSKNESCFAASNFQQHGYHFAVLNYTLAPQASLSTIVEECRQALTFLYQHAEQYGYNKDEIYLSGSSAGGHLAMMMALTDWHAYDIPPSFIKGICAVSGIYDLTPIAQTYINKPLQLTEKEIQDHSPLLRTIDRDLISQCQITLAYGDNETDEFKRQSQAMQRAIEQLNVPSNCQEISGRNHFDVILDLSESDSWLAQQVFKQMS
ncbi:esterase [Thalassotalea insulae]|uniref:Esterase n=1 Tax=Thalassotalea insulae TaxID=2056778 RepID=A0ABQ6GVZ6_9GAMM|nr:alpha/beta hydrolase [Thalassotalea insulae]GLX78812.1 esterase [Thalassotalea insulae]